jgi:hypothetical protein
MTKMTTIYNPEQSAAILSAAHDVLLGNNGWAFVSGERWLLDGLQAAGFTVIRSRDWHGRPAWKAYTRAAQDALRAHGDDGWSTESTYKRARQMTEGPDYEAAILARQERQADYW